MKSYIKLILLFLVACISSVAIYYLLVPEDKMVPISIEIRK